MRINLDIMIDKISIKFRMLWRDYKNKLKQIKWPREPLPLKLLTRKPEEEELKPSPSISTRSSSKSTQTSESQRRPWTSWTLSSTTLLTESPLKAQNSSDSTREELSHLVKSNLPSSSSSQENSPDTPSLKEPKPSPNTSNNDINRLLICAVISSFTFFILYSTYSFNTFLAKKPIFFYTFGSIFKIIRWNKKHKNCNTQKRKLWFFCVFVKVKVIILTEPGFIRNQENIIQKIW